MRQDIKNLQVIVMAIEHKEKTASLTLKEAAEIDNLYSTLKSQVKTVIEIQHLEELTDKVRH